MIPGNKANKGDVYLHSTLIQSDMKNAPAVMPVTSQSVFRQAKTRYMTLTLHIMALLSL